MGRRPAAGRAPARPLRGPLRALPGGLDRAPRARSPAGSRRCSRRAFPRRRSPGSWCASRVSLCSRSRCSSSPSGSCASAAGRRCSRPPALRLAARRDAGLGDAARRADGRGGAVPRPAADPRGDSRRQRRRARRQPRPLPAGHDAPGRLSRRPHPLAHPALGARALSVRRPAARAAGGARDLARGPRQLPHPGDHRRHEGLPGPAPDRPARGARRRLSPARPRARARGARPGARDRSRRGTSARPCGSTSSPTGRARSSSRPGSSPRRR